MQILTDRFAFAKGWVGVLKGSVSETHVCLQPIESINQNRYWHWVVPRREIKTMWDILTQAIKEGNDMKVFMSGGGLRVVRIEDQAGRNTGYGESFNLENALEHASVSFSQKILDYGKLYSGEDALFTHYLTGSSDTSSYHDSWIRRGMCLAAYLREDGKILVGFSMYERDKIPDEVYKKASMTGVVQKYTSPRNITYNVEPGNISSVFDNPENKMPFEYNLLKIGQGDTFKQAMDNSILHKGIEIGNCYSSSPTLNKLKEEGDALLCKA